jgi:hypothetical protein
MSLDMGFAILDRRVARLHRHRREAADPEWGSLLALARLHARLLVDGGVPGCAIFHRRLRLQSAGRRTARRAGSEGAR